MMNEFRVHLLNDTGLAKANELGEAFSALLEKIDSLVPHPSRERSLVTTKLQEASFWAKRAIAVLPENQEPAKWHPPGRTDTPLSVGDTVTLNSGGPPMKVIEVSKSDGDDFTSAVAWWRDAKGKPQFLEIDVRCLQLISRSGT